METSHSKIRGRCAAALFLVAGTLGSAAALADSPYQADRAYCLSPDAREDQALCLREAAAARAERHPGKWKREDRAPRTHAASANEGSSGQKPAASGPA